MGCESYQLGRLNAGSAEDDDPPDEAWGQFDDMTEGAHCLCTFPQNHASGERLSAKTVEALALLGAAVVLMHRDPSLLATSPTSGGADVLLPHALPAWIRQEIARLTTEPVAENWINLASIRPLTAAERELAQAASTRNRVELGLVEPCFLAGTHAADEPCWGPVTSYPDAVSDGAGGDVPIWERACAGHAPMLDGGAYAREGEAGTFEGGQA